MKFKYFIFFILNILVALAYYFNDRLQIPSEYYNVVILLWNVVFGIILATIFLGKEFFTQLKITNIKWIILGLSLTTFVAYFGNYLYATYIATPTTNILANYITIKMLLFTLPILALGEELLSLNLTQALNKIGLNFWISTFIVAIFFAFWHINSFGYVPIQLLMTLAPIRIALNYTWKESGKNLIVVWLVHYLFNIIAFTIYY